MAVFLHNACKYRNCGAPPFSTLVELIYHIEEQHYSPIINGDPSLANLISPPSVLKLYCLNSTGASSNANAYSFPGRAAKQKKKTALNTQSNMSDLFVHPSGQSLGGVSASDMHSPYDESLLVDEDGIMQQEFSDILGPASTTMLPQKLVRGGNDQSKLPPRPGDQSKLMRTGREPPRMGRGNVAPRAGAMPTQQRTEIMFECPDCTRTFATDSEFRAHQKAAHEGGGVAARVTSTKSGGVNAQSSVLASFLSNPQSSMQTPQSADMSSQGGECACPICGRGCKNRNALSRHIRNVHPHGGGLKATDTVSSFTPGFSNTGPSGYVNAGSYSNQGGSYVQNVNYVSSSASGTQQNYGSQSNYTTLNSGGNYSINSNMSYVASSSPSNAGPNSAYTVGDQQMGELGGPATQAQTLTRRTGAAQPGRIVTAATQKRKLQE